jgi:hypothetical protein
VNLDQIRTLLLSTSEPYAPALFMQAGRHRTLRARLAAAEGALTRLGSMPANDAALAEAVFELRGDPRKILRLLHYSELPTVPATPGNRAIFGFDAHHFKGWGQLVDVRLGACAAAELIWFFYAQGIILARDAAPVDSLRTDMHALAMATNSFAVADYPGVALAFGAALHSDDGPPGQWNAYAALVATLAERHIGGRFATRRDRVRVGEACEWIAGQVVRRLAEGGIPPFFTAPRLAGLLVQGIDEAVPHLGLTATDQFGDFEEAANQMVFETLRAGAVNPEVLRALDELHEALKVDV